MAVALVQSTKYTGTAAQTNMAFTLGTTPTVGNVLVVICAYYTGDAPFVVPSGWTLRHKYEPNQVGIAAISRTVVSGDTTSWNLTMMSVADQNSGFMMEFSGADMSNVFNILGDAASATAVTTLTSGNAVPTALGCYAFAVFVNNGSGGTDAATFSTGWTKTQAAESTFQPAWLATRTSLTSDLSTAINTTITAMNGSGANSAGVTMLVAPAGSMGNHFLATMGVGR